jgi:hypothetical protein
MSNRSHPTSGTPPAPAIRVQGDGAARPKNHVARDLALHSSVTVAQREGLGHPTAGINPMAPLRADDNRGKPTKNPALHDAMHGMDRATNHDPARGDALLAEAACNNMIAGEKSHSITGPKTKGSC